MPEHGRSGGFAAWRGRNVNTSGNCVGTCVEEIKRIEESWGNFNAETLQGIPAFPVSLFKFPKWLFLPERLLAFDLVLRRIRSKTLCAGVRLQNNDP